MKKLSLLALGAMLLSSTAVFASNSDTDNVQILAEIVEGLTVEGKRALDFGKIIKPSAVGTVKVGTGGARTVPTGALTVFDTATSGLFTVSGEPGKVVSISTTNATETISNGGGATMSVGSFEIASDGSYAAGSLTLNSTDGEESVYVGGTLSVGASQASGQYSGTVTLQASY